MDKDNEEEIQIICQQRLHEMIPRLEELQKKLGDGWLPVGRPIQDIIDEIDE